MRRYRKSKNEKQILTDNPETAKRQKAGKEIQMKKRKKKDKSKEMKRDRKAEEGKCCSKNTKVENEG